MLGDHFALKKLSEVASKDDLEKERNQWSFIPQKILSIESRLSEKIR